MRIRSLMIGSSALYAVAVLVCCGGAFAADKPEGLAKYPYELKPPIVWGKDYVEVSRNDTLLRRFRYWGDFEREMASYLADAREQAAKVPPNKLKILYVVFKDLRVPVKAKKPNAGKPEPRGKAAAKIQEPAEEPQLRTISVSDSRIERIRVDCQKYADWILAWSHGRCEVEWDIAVVKEAITYPARDGNWWPFAVKEQLENALAGYDNKYQFMIFFDVPTGGGEAFTQRRLLGAYTISLSLSDLGFIAHEMAHQLFDANMPRTEGGLDLNILHGLGLYGWERSDLKFPELLSTYRNFYYYVYSPDMWGRLSITATNRYMPHEPFSGKAYDWERVKDDRYFKLPELSATNLNELTGLKGLAVDAPARKAYLLLTVSDTDKANVISRLVDGSKFKADMKAMEDSNATTKKTKDKPKPVVENNELDKELNNLAWWYTESVAVLATKTGQWLFVKVDLVDFYVNMNKIADRGTVPLPVYGYINGDAKRAVFVLKAPADMPVPTCEAGYFRDQAPGAAALK